MKYDWNNIPKALWPFVAHGCEFSVQAKTQWQGTAPFSEKEDKFYVNPETGLWDDKYTGDYGNVQTFFTKMAEYYKSQTSPALLQKLAKLRKLPVEAFKGLGIGWNGGAYMVPCRGLKGTVRDILRWSEKAPRLQATKGVDTQLWNAEVLRGAKSGRRVWLCEGAWDGIALRWVLKTLGKSDYVVAVPGNALKEEWIEWMRGLSVVACYDNDLAGDREAARARKMFRASGMKLSYLNWPDHWESGWDVRDFWVYALENDVKLEVAWKKFESLVSPVHRRDNGEGEDSDKKQEDKVVWLPDNKAPTFEQLQRTFSKYLYMDDEMVLALKFMLAIVYSQQLGETEPLWAYLVAAAGGGKTALLSALSGCRQTVFRSTVTPNSLVSGFKAAEDPSLLPKLSGKTFVIKDFTTTLSGPEFEFELVMAILRDAFDGEFTRSYGNDVTREYKKLHFSMVAGVTPAIHAKPMAMMGERFLKFNMRTANLQDRMKRLMFSQRDMKRDHDMAEELSKETGRFLSRKLEEADLPAVPQQFLGRVAALSQLLSVLRAQVLRDRWDRDRLVHRPEPEVGTRPFRQFLKLSKSLVFLLRKKTYDEEIYRLVERVALDSCTGFNVEIVKECMRRQATKEGLPTITDLSVAMGVSYSTVERAVRDLESLRVLVGIKSAHEKGSIGRPSNTWKVQGEVAEAWKSAKVGVVSLKLGGNNASA